MDNGISSQRHAFSPVRSDTINAQDSAKEATIAAKEQLRSLAIEDRLQSTLSELKARVSGAPTSLSKINEKLASFWNDMMDTFEELSGLDEVEHIHDRDLSHLRSKGNQLMGMISRMPDGLEKDAASSTVSTFISAQKTRIESEYQARLAQSEKHADLGSKEFMPRISLSAAGDTSETPSSFQSASVATGNNTLSETLRPSASSWIDSELAHFWDDQIEDAKMRFGRDAIEHRFTTDLGYLTDKVAELEGKIIKMPDGVEKDAASNALQRFFNDQKQGIERSYQNSMDNLSLPAPGSQKRPFVAPQGLFETVEALTDELQGATYLGSRRYKVSQPSKSPTSD